MTNVDPESGRRCGWRSARTVRVHKSDPEFRAAECLLKFTLTYDGQLKTGQTKRGSRKHAIRRDFHKQLKRLWQVNPLLSNWMVPGPQQHLPIPAQEWIQSRIAHLDGYRFVPLVTKELCVECALEFHILRPTDKPGRITDIDNQVKVLVDALKMPKNRDDLGDSAQPDESELPFFVLLEDDRLVAKISSVNDELLCPVASKSEIDTSDVRVTLSVHIRPQLPLAQNVIFFSDNPAPWDHKYDETIPLGLEHISNAELRARATQCIFRIRALAENFTSWRSASFYDRRTQEDWHVFNKKLGEDSALMQQIWRGNLHPRANAIWTELLRRIYGEGPYPSNHRTFAIEEGMLAGPSPLNDAANELESLVRQII